MLYRVITGALCVFCVFFPSLMGFYDGINSITQFHTFMLCESHLFKLWTVFWGPHVSLRTSCPFIYTYRILVKTKYFRDCVTIYLTQSIKITFLRLNTFSKTIQCTFKFVHNCLQRGDVTVKRLKDVKMSLFAHNSITVCHNKGLSVVLASSYNVTPPKKSDFYSLLLL